MCNKFNQTVFEFMHNELALLAVIISFFGSQRIQNKSNIGIPLIFFKCFLALWVFF